MHKLRKPKQSQFGWKAGSAVPGHPGAVRRYDAVSRPPPTELANRPGAAVMSTDIPPSRVYIHQRCGEPTEVSGPEFSALANPLAEMERTFCSNCQQYDTIDQFSWADTGEPISVYYQRYLQAMPAVDRQATARSNLLRCIIGAATVGLAISIVITLLLMTLLGTLFAILLGLLAALLLVPLLGLLGFQYFEKSVVQPILRRLFGVDDPRQLH